MVITAATHAHGIGEYNRPFISSKGFEKAFRHESPDFAILHSGVMRFPLEQLKDALCYRRHDVSR
jgi:hypothetical protein